MEIDSPNPENTESYFQEIKSTLKQAFESVETEIKITKQPNSKEYGPFNFQIHANCAILHGRVNHNLSLKIKNVDGKPLINIKPYFAFLENGRKFGISQGTTQFGILEVNPLNNTLLLTSSDLTYTVNKLGNDYLISKHDSRTTLARIHIPPPSSGYIVQPFECFVRFQALNTAVEKSLFISLAVAIMMVRNGPVMPKERDPACPVICCLSFCVIACVAIVVVIAVRIGYGYDDD